MRLPTRNLPQGGLSKIRGSYTQHNPPSTMNLKLIFILGCGLLPLIGCSTYRAKSHYQAEMLLLCEQQGLPQVNRVVELPPEHFDKNGHVRLQVPAPSSNRAFMVAGRYERVSSETVLKREPNHRLSLRMLETSYTDRQTGEVLGSQKDFCRDGGDSLAPNNTIECCPSQQSLTEAIFKESLK